MIVLMPDDLYFLATFPYGSGVGGRVARFTFAGFPDWGAGALAPRFTGLACCRVVAEWLANVGVGKDGGEEESEEDERYCCCACHGWVVVVVEWWRRWWW